MHPCHQGANPLVPTFRAQGDEFLKIQMLQRPLIMLYRTLFSWAVKSCI